MAVTPEIEAAIAEISAQHPTATITVTPDGDGGAFVTLDRVPLGPQYNQDATWIKFHITVNYPIADVYPHFIEPTVRLKDTSYPDASPFGEGSGLGTFKFENQDLHAIQVSRRSNHLNPAIDTAALKLAKVLHWLESRS